MPVRLASRIGNVLVGLLVWGICAAVAMLTLGAWPRTLTGWVLILALGPLVLVIGEALGEVAIEGGSALPPVQRISRWVKLRAPVSDISVLRIATLLVAALVLIGLLLAVGLLGNAVFGDQLEPFDTFMHRHFH